MRFFTRRALLVLGATAIALGSSSCSVEELLSEPGCDDADSLLLTAQSVPAAALVPCLDGLPVGWESASVSFENTGTRVRFDSDRAGRNGARFTYADSCDRQGATEVASLRPGVRHFVAPSSEGQQETTLLIFDGGCVTWEVNTAGPEARNAVEALMARLQFVERRVLDEIAGPTGRPDAN